VALGKDTLYALGDSGILVCLDPTTGKELWRTDLGKAAYRISWPVVHRGKVLVVAGETLTLFRDARQPNLLGECDLKDGIMGAPSVVQDRVYVATTKYLYCLEIPDTAKAE
jgi:outer membrane protein assembly factor BamB